jgi:hypothetical protein
MKRMLLLLVSLLLISSVAMADHIGIYSDANGSSCNLGAPGFSSTATIIHKFNLGATGSRFKATFPAGTSFFVFATSYTTIGVLTSDLSLGYGTCVFGSIVLGNIVALLTPGKLEILPADAKAHIVYTNCIFEELVGTGGTACVGCGDDPCSVLPVEPSTWGGVKALYR